MVETGFKHGAYRSSKVVRVTLDDVEGIVDIEARCHIVEK